MDKKFNYGGQAVIEGVMMRGRTNYAIAVRKQDGRIDLFRDSVKPIAKKYPILGLPFVRGTVALFDSLILGIKSITYSANVYDDNEEKMTYKDTIMMYASVGVAFILAILLFFVLPTFVTNYTKVFIRSPFGLNIFEGILRVVIFLAYLISISFMKDIKRVFEYHGAEHKVIHCLEHGEELTVENARKYTTLHPRCGTNFLFVVMIVSILVFSVFQWPVLYVRILSRIFLLPVVAGLSYEFIKYAGNTDSKIIKYISLPGLYLQKLTTRQPDDSQIEVALCSLKCVLKERDDIDCP